MSLDSVATGNGLFALDIDVKNGARGEESLRELITQHGPMPATLTNRTWSGGRQFLFQHANGIAVKTQAGDLAPSIDVRADGGYIVIPPSVVNGKPYAWEHAELEPVLLPDWVRLAPLKDAKPQKAAQDWSQDAPTGRRNDRAYRFACLLRKRALSEEDGWRALVDWNLTHCVPPLDHDELRQCLQHAWEQHRPGFATSDLGNAERLIAEHGLNLRHLPELGWLRWDGSRWTEDRESSSW